MGPLRPLEAWVLAPFAGWAAVGWMLYVVHLPPLEFLPFLRLPSWLMLGVAGGLVWWMGRRHIALVVGERGEGREARAVLGATAVIGILYLLNYDRDAFAFSCTHRSVSIATDVSVGALWEAVNAPRVFLFDDETDMHGVTALLSVFPSVLGFFGVRLAYAALHAGIAATAYVAARRWGVRRTGADAVFLVAALHPAMVGTVVDDVNHVALLLSLVLWAVAGGLVRSGPAVGGLGKGDDGGVERDGRAGGIGLGLLAGLAVGAWHPFVVSLPAVVWVRRRSLRWLVVGLGIGVLPFLLRHTLAFGSPFTLETWRDNAAAAHTLAGLGFEYAGLLNWPLHEAWVRTPGNPFPVGLLLPLYLLATTGTAVVAVALLGAGRGGRRFVGAAALWVLPGVGLLAVQENWFEPEKLQIATVWLAPLAVLLGRGVDGLIERPQRLAPALLIAVLLGVGASSLSVYEGTIDPRLQARWPHVRNELPVEVNTLRASLTRGRAWPTYTVLGADRRSWTDRVVALGEDLGAPRFSQRRESPWEHTLSVAAPEPWRLFLQGRERDEFGDSEGAAGVPVVIDLESFDARPLVHRSDGLGGEPPGAFRVSWSDQTLHVAAFRARAAPRDVHVVLYPPPPAMLEDLKVELPGVDVGEFPPALPPDVDRVQVRREGARLTIEVPPDARLQIRELISVEPTRTRRWVVEPPGDAAVGQKLRVLGPDLLRFN